MTDSDRAEAAQREIVHTEAEVLRDDEEPIIAEPLDGPVTVGDIVEGAREVLGEVGTSARRLIDRGRYRKVRITRKGKPLLPDVPLAAAAAIEAASLYSVGIARVFAANVGARFLFDVEIVNEADKHLDYGKAALLDGDLEVAKEALMRAVRIDDTHAEAFLQLGVVYKLLSENELALSAFEQAETLDPSGDFGKRALELARSLKGDRDR